MKKIIFAFILIAVLIAGSACEAKTAVDAPSDAEETGDQIVEEEDSGAEAEDASGGDTGEVLTCFNANNYILSFDHTLTVNEQGTSLTHILRQGSIALIGEADSAAHDTLLKAALPQALNFEYMGSLGPCTVNAGGQVTVSAEGYCEDGIVYLNITESWGPTEGSMTCDGETVPFSAPGYTHTHSGASGLGEEFLITDDASGHTLMKPFLGGEGYHSWTLQMDIDLVPLVPEE